MGIKSKIAYFFCVLWLSCSLAGCKADIDLSEVDWSTSVNASLTLPLGTLSADFGDFIGTSQFPKITVDTTGRYVYRDTISSTNQYHPVDLSTLVSRSKSQWNVADEVDKIFAQLKDKHPLIIQVLKLKYPDLEDFSSIPLPFIIPAEEYMKYFQNTLTFDLEFPIDIDFKQLNEKFENRRVDLVLSGINHGSNAAVNVMYSGTMGAAIEGSFYGVPSIGLSLDDHDADADFAGAVKYGRKIIAAVLEAEGRLPRPLCLNVNVPRCGVEEIQGVRLCRQTRGFWREEFYERTDPHGRGYFWLTGAFQNAEPEAEDTDEWALAHRYVSVVPVQTDMTDYRQLKALDGVL